MTSSATAASLPGGNTVLVEIVDRVAWVTMNRPEKRNAINPALSFEMLDVFEALDSDERCGALVLTGAGEAYSSGMDLREYFRATDKLSYDERLKVMRKSALAQWKRLQFYGKPTIAMVNGWCFGGAFNSMIACDLAIAAEDATFGLSEINWGIIPAGTVTKAVASVMGQRDTMYYIMTGETFDGRKAASMGLVNEAVPRAELRARVQKLAAHPDREKSHGAAHRQARGAPRARHVVGGRRGLFVRKTRPVALSRPRKGPREGHDAVPRRQIVPAGTGRLSPRQLSARVTVQRQAIALRPLLRPRSVAIVGVSPEAGSLGGNVLTNLTRIGFKGDIHLVSRNNREIGGRTCVGSIDELPDGIDVAVLAVPRQASVDAVKACVRRKIGAALVFASGFAEMDEAGRADQDAMARIANDGEAGAVRTELHRPGQSDRPRRTDIRAAVIAGTSPRTRHRRRHPKRRHVLDLAAGLAGEGAQALHRRLHRQ